MTTLPSFRALALAAAELHLHAVPFDGAALVLAKLAPATPMLDHEIVPALQHAQSTLAGAISVLQELHDSPQAAARLVTCLDAHGAYHQALMAYYGVDVTAEQEAA